VELYWEYLADIDRISQRWTNEEILEHPFCEYALKAMQWQAERSANEYLDPSDSNNDVMEIIRNAGTEDAI